MSSEVVVTHQPDSHRFEVNADGYVAVLEYVLTGQVITFTHTGVPGELEGRGIGSALVRTGLDYARAQSLKVVPLCSFVASYIQRKPEYQDLL